MTFGSRHIADIAGIGDSPNDEPMFGHFPHAVGVANAAKFAAGMTHPPAYVMQGRCGAGFVELGQRLLALKRPYRGAAPAVVAYPWSALPS